jgi:hypothetical protein
MSTGSAGTSDSVAMLMRPKRIEYYLPFMIGVWLDAICLGLLCVTFGAWLGAVRKTDRPMVRYLVLYLMVASLMLSGFMLAHNWGVYVKGWGDYFQLFDTSREYPDHNKC